MNENNSCKDYACKYQAHYVSWVRKEINSLIEVKNSKRNNADKKHLCYSKALSILDDLAKEEDQDLAFILTLLNAMTNRLMEARPLTPITDEENEWTFVFYSGDNGKDEVYQNKRYSSLFKHIKENGNIQYTDGDRYRNFDTNDPNSLSIVSIPDGLMQKLVDEMFPIEMPYFPPDNPYLVKAENIENQELGKHIRKISYIIDPFGTKHNVNRMFMYDDDFTEISKEDFDKINSKKGQETDEN